MTPLRFLGACGLASSLLSAVAGFCHLPFLLGCAGLVMTAGNVVAMVGEPRKRSRVQCQCYYCLQEAGLLPKGPAHTDGY